MDSEGSTWQQRLSEGFDQHNSFPEYNSPTYYGINLYALGLWRHYSSEPELNRVGEHISHSALAGYRRLLSSG